jgi:hypothetical protein
LLIKTLAPVAASLEDADYRHKTLFPLEMPKKTIEQLILTTIVFILSQLILAAILSYLNLGYGNPANWARWDSGHYLAIATTGYEFFPCAGKFGYPLTAKEFCGNTGWFPGYPFLIRIFSLLSGNTLLLAGLLSKAFYFFSLFMVLIISGVHRISLKNILFLCLAAFSFGHIYYNAIFPISTLVLCALLGFHFILKKKLFLAGIFCLIASFLYPTGFLLSIVFSLFILLNGDGNLIEKFKKIVFLGAMGLAGVLLVFLVLYIEVGEWSAFIKVQGKYGHGLHNPNANIGAMLNKITVGFFYINNFVYYQSILAIAGYLMLSFVFFIKKLYKNDLYLLTWLYLTFFLIVPWIIGGDFNMYRAEALLFPYVFLFKETKIQWQAALLLILLGIGIPMCQLFFTSVII